MAAIDCSPDNRNAGDADQGIRSRRTGDATESDGTIARGLDGSKQGRVSII
jgi:hypothetical protein